MLLNRIRIRTRVRVKIGGLLLLLLGVERAVCKSRRPEMCVDVGRETSDCRLLLLLLLLVLLIEELLLLLLLLLH